MQILGWLWDFLAIFTQAKSFESNRVLGARPLNLMGLHAGRVVLAHLAMRIRRILLIWRLPREHRRQFIRDGFLVIENVLSEAQSVDAVSCARELALTRGSVSVQGNSLTRQWALNPWSGSSPAIIQSIVSVAAIRNALSYVAGRTRTPFFWLQQIRQNPAWPKPDPQFLAHADSFQPGMKAWLFLTDVDEKNGPLYFHPGSHRLTWKRLRWEYRQSLSGSKLPDAYSARGSMRIESEALSDMGFARKQAFNVKANTLVIIDTYGFHGRTAAGSGAERLEIWSLSRSNPFNPFPGLPFKFLNRVDVALFNWFQVRRKESRRRRRREEAESTD